MSTPIAPQQAQEQAKAPQEISQKKPAPGGSASLQLKGQLAGMSYADQAAALAPPGPFAIHGGGGAVQAEGGVRQSADVHAAAAHGISGGGGALPHMGAIQQAFGAHDVSGINAHVGGKAQEASDAMGASAYATGNDIAFAKAPSLHTAAHEAAHVVQQRAGVSLEGGVGKVGDSYEAHADKVADAVVAGHSAEPILNEMSGGAPKAEVQQKALQRNATDASPSSGTRTGALGPTASRMSVTPVMAVTADPVSFAGSLGHYEGNFQSVKGNIVERGGDASQVGAFEGRKGEWYRRWGRAALQDEAHGAAAEAEFAALNGDLKTIFPDDSPDASGGHLYSGYAAGGSGRGRAEESAAEANAGTSGVTHRTLEKTLVGNLFDGVAKNVRDNPREQARWIPYSAGATSEWWSLISADFANTFVGSVHAHVDVGMPYFVGRVGKGKSAAERRAMTGELAACIALDASVFRDDELPRIADLMEVGVVSELLLHLRVEVVPGTVREITVTVPASAGVTKAAIVAQVDTALKGLVSVAEISANIT